MVGSAQARFSRAGKHKGDPGRLWHKRADQPFLAHVQHKDDQPVRKPVLFDDFFLAFSILRIEELNHFTRIDTPIWS